MTEIQANITLSAGGGGVRALNEDSRGGGSDPLSLSDLDMDDIIFNY